MAKAADINAPIIEALYCEALVLADDVRASFDLAPPSSDSMAEDLTRVALSAEGLKTTTRMMHVLAWLLNHRAYFAGELSEFQLRRHSLLPVDRPADPANLDRLEPATCELIEETEALHARIARLDSAWRERFEMQPAAVLRLRDRLHKSLALGAEGN